jgi:twitching motility protein PilT
MAEKVMGLGQQKSLKAVIQNAESEFLRYEGAPRKISGRSGWVEFVAERDGFEGEFERFRLRIKADKQTKEKLAAVYEKVKPYATHAEDEEGWQVYTTPKEGSTDYVSARNAVEHLIRQTIIPEVWRLEGADYANDPISVELLFRALIQYKASDIHLSPGQKPIFRIDNHARASDLMGVMSAPQIMQLIREMSPANDFKEFEETLQNSFSFHQKGIGYARVSCFMRMGAPHMTFRYHSEYIPNFEDLNIPDDVMTELAKMHNGLVLICGMTGSGKSSTCAALLNWINRNKHVHILTLEDPVEYHHQNVKSFVNQRNKGTDFVSFALGVEGALRHDPDVILVGEMRDPNTIRAAIGAASTGHLVLSTLHSNDASGVVNRIASFFDPVERDLVRQQLNDCVRAIICQKLVQRKGGGRVPALELLFNDVKPISRAMAEGNTVGIRIGMQQTLSASMLFEHYIYSLYKRGIVEFDIAREAAPEVSLFDQIHMGTYSVPRLG